MVGALALALIGAVPGSRPCRVIVPGEAATATPPTRACEQRVYLHANGDWGRGRLGNLGTAAATGTTPTWDPHPPQRSLGPWSGAASLSAPAGGPGTWVAGRRARDAAGAVFAGGFVGNLDTMAVDLYLSAPGHREGIVAAATTDEQFAHDAHAIPAWVSLTVDDTEHVWDDVEIALYDPPQAPVGTFIGRLAFTGLFDGQDRPRARHLLRLTIVTSRVALDEAVVLFDAVEVPSSIHFNRADVTGYPRLPVRDAETGPAPQPEGR